MAYDIGARIILHAVEQDQKIPIRFCMCITVCTGAIQHNVHIGCSLVHSLFDAFKEFCLLHCCTVRFFCHCGGFVRSSLRSYNTNELPGKFRECCDRLMDAVSEADKIEILRTRNNALMIGVCGV